MKKLLFALMIILLPVMAVANVNLGIKKADEFIVIPLLTLDSAGVDAAPDSIQILTWLDGGTGLQFSARSTTYPFSAISVDTSKIFADTTYWFVEQIQDIDGSPTPQNYSLAIDVITWVKVIPTHNRATVQVISDSLEVMVDDITTIAADVVNIDAWAPILDNDSLIIDQSSLQDMTVATVTNVTTVDNMAAAAVDDIWDTDTSTADNAGSYGQVLKRASDSSVATQIDVVNFDGWNPILDGDSLIIDQSSLEDMTVATVTNVTTLDNMAAAAVDDIWDADTNTADVASGFGLALARGWDTTIAIIDSIQNLATLTDLQAIGSRTVVKRGIVKTLPDVSGFSSTVFTEADDYWIDNLIEMRDGTAIGQITRISDFTASTDSATFSPSFSVEPAIGDSFYVLAAFSESPSSGGFDTLSTVFVDRLTGRVADTTWDALVSARSGVAGSFGDSSLGWGATSAGGTDTSNIKIMMAGNPEITSGYKVGYKGRVNDVSPTNGRIIVAEIDVTKADDFYNDMALLWYTGALTGESQLILDWDNTNDSIITRVFSAAPADNDSFVIVRSSFRVVDTIRSNVITSTSIANNAIGSNELATDAIDEIWEYDTSLIATDASLGKAVKRASDTSVAIQLEVVNIDAWNPGTDNVLPAADVDLIWDEVLTNAAHNVSQSSGKRLRDLSDRGVLTEGTAQSGTATSITLAAATSFADGILAGQKITLIENTGAEQTRYIATWTSSTDVATLHPGDDWATNPDATTKYVVHPGGAVDVVNIQDTAVSDIWDADTNTVDVAASFGATLKSIRDSMDATSMDNLREAFDDDGVGSDMDLNQLTIVATTTDDNAVIISGDGTGEGLSITGGATGFAATLNGGTAGSVGYTKLAGDFITSALRDEASLSTWNTSATTGFTGGSMGDSAIGGINTWGQGGGGSGLDTLNTAFVDRLTGRIADTTWDGLVSARSGVTASFGDSSLGWGATSAGGDASPSAWDAADSAVVGGLIDDSVWQTAFSTAFDAGSMGDSLNNATYVQGSPPAGANVRGFYVIDTSGVDDTISAATVTLQDATGSDLGVFLTTSPGIVTVNLPDGTHTAGAIKNGFTFIDTVFSATGNDTLVIRGFDSFNPGTPASADLSRVSGFLRTIEDKKIDGATIIATFHTGTNQVDSTGTAVIVADVVATAPSDSTGFFFLDLRRTTTYADTSRGFYDIRGYWGEKVLFEVLRLYIPAAGNINLGDTLALRK